jgi:hypothetical protein
MPKISIYLDEKKLKQIEQLINNDSHLMNFSRSALIGYLIEQEVARFDKRKMVEAAEAIDELDLGWSEKEQECAIIDAEAFG